MDTNTRQMIYNMLQSKRILQNSHCCAFEKTPQSGVPFQMFGGTNTECKTNVEYNKIMSDIKSFLSNYCIHEWTTDDIDITPEISQKITYCELCETCTGFKNALSTNSSSV